MGRNLTEEGERSSPTKEASGAKVQRCEIQAGGSVEAARWGGDVYSRKEAPQKKQGQQWDPSLTPHFKP